MLCSSRSSPRIAAAVRHRYLAVDVVCSTFDSVLATLEELADGEDCSRATEATGIWMQVQTFKFLLSLIIFWRVLSCTKSLSDQLQSTEMDLAKAADLVLATISTLEEFRSDSQWDHRFKYVKDVADLHSISVALPRPCRRKLLPRRLEDGVVLESMGVIFLSPSPWPGQACFGYGVFLGKTYLEILITSWRSLVNYLH